MTKEQQTLVDQIVKNLHEGIVEFTYKKKDGSTREAKGTLVEDLLPESSKDDTRKTAIHETCIYYYDLNSSGWRAFLKENLVSIK